MKAWDFLEPWVDGLGMLVEMVGMVVKDLMVVLALPAAILAFWWVVLG